MTTFQRYAVFYAPEPGPLADFAADWLGWDAVSGSEKAHPHVADLPLPISGITETPRKYGFHGTIKPPFRLAEGATAADLVSDFKALSAELAPVELEGLELSQLGRFLALTPTGDQTALLTLAATIVERLDHHRRPQSEVELERRRGLGLNARQEANLVTWGYPYVMEDFRFHMTLTGKLPKADAKQTREVLEPLLAPILPKPFVVNALCLFGEAKDGRFHLTQRFALSGSV